jgi:hypothetical protein
MLPTKTDEASFSFFSEEPVDGVLGTGIAAFVPDVTVHRPAAVHEHNQVYENVHDGNAPVFIGACPF